VKNSKWDNEDTILPDLLSELQGDSSVPIFPPEVMDQPRLKEMLELEKQPTFEDNLFPKKSAAFQPDLMKAT